MICINKPIKMLIILTLVDKNNNLFFILPNSIVSDKKQYVTAPHKIDETSIKKNVTKKITRNIVCFLVQSLLSMISFNVVDDITNVMTNRSEIYWSVLSTPNSKIEFKAVLIPIGRTEKNTE